MSEYSPDQRAKTSFATPPNFASPVGTGGTSSPHLAEKNPARAAYKHLVECVYCFEKSLSEDQEVGVNLSSSGVPLKFYLQDLACYPPHILAFSGMCEAGEKQQLIQHVSQLNVFLTALNKRGEDTVRIGFRLKREMEEG